ncbi:sugar-binding protein [Glycomyces paridis]|uniref:Sugar ABC transporter substrate-binding protein n=1 Tax=Glycomyces paridis TaxID=2126555 RepID=A0A4S8PSR5_9ACTN|nr:sugar-binding protein [Glycomyces paridis]THV31214.1 sugar ABC transporter substrate-binding protein [Glycomyces paridis]
MHLSRRGLLFGSAGLAATSLAGCGADGESGALTGHTGIAMPTTTSDRWVVEGADLEKRLKGFGYETILSYGEDNVEMQIEQIRSMIDKGVEFLIVGAIGNDSLGAVLAEAKNKGVTVIAYDRLILDTPDVDYYASFDNYEVGVLQAQHIIETLKLDEREGPFNVELFSGALDDNNSQYFFMGGLDTLESYLYSGVVQIPSDETEQEPTSTERWDRGVARERMTQLLDDHYGERKLHAVLSPYDGISRGVVEALVAADYDPKSDDFPVVTGQDAEPLSLKAIKEGTGQSETVFKDTRKLAEVAANMVKAIVDGGTPEVNDLGSYDNGFQFIPAYLLPPVDVTAENYQEEIVDTGYLSEGEIDEAEPDQG